MGHQHQQKWLARKQCCRKSVRRSQKRARQQNEYGQNWQRKRRICSQYGIKLKRRGAPRNKPNDFFWSAMRKSSSCVARTGQVLQLLLRSEVLALAEKGAHYNLPL